MGNALQRNVTVTWAPDVPCHEDEWAISAKETFGDKESPKCLHLGVLTMSQMSRMVAEGKGCAGCSSIFAACAAYYILVRSIDQNVKIPSGGFVLWAVNKAKGGTDGGISLRDALSAIEDVGCVGNDSYDDPSGKTMPSLRALEEAYNSRTMSKRKVKSSKDAILACLYSATPVVFAFTYLGFDPMPVMLEDGRVAQRIVAREDKERYATRRGWGEMPDMLTAVLTGYDGGSGLFTGYVSPPVSHHFPERPIGFPVSALEDQICCVDIWAIEKGNERLPWAEGRPEGDISTTDSETRSEKEGSEASHHEGSDVSQEDLKDLEVVD